MTYYERALSLADSLKFEPIKALAYQSIVGNYLAADQPQKALNYFNEHPQLKQFLETVNFGHFVDQSYGYIYAQLGNYDSSKYYYNKVAPFFESGVSNGRQFSYYYQLGVLYKKTKEYDKSLEYFMKAKQISAAMELQNMMYVVSELDSVYQAKGDYKQAFEYHKLYSDIKDTLLNEQSNKQITEMSVKYESEKKRKRDPTFNQR